VRRAHDALELHSVIAPRPKQRLGLEALLGFDTSVWTSVVRFQRNLVGNSASAKRDDGAAEPIPRLGGLQEAIVER
jgi:hypothetical protein